MALLPAAHKTRPAKVLAPPAYPIEDPQATDNPDPSEFHQTQDSTHLQVMVISRKQLMFSGNAQTAWANSKQHMPKIAA